MRANPARAPKIRLRYVRGVANGHGHWPPFARAHNVSKTSPMRKTATELPDPALAVYCITSSLLGAAVRSGNSLTMTRRRDFSFRCVFAGVR